MESGAPLTDADVKRIRAGRGGAGWSLIRAIHKRRPILTAVLVLIAPIHAFLTRTPPVDLLTPSAELRFILPWLLMPIGAVIRIWGSGNLRKNEEVTCTGVYAMVRHPLYTGSLAFFLAYFLTVGDPLIGLILFSILVFGVYYPTMMGEEEYLSIRFPDAAATRAGMPRLIPNPRRMPAALRTDRFSQSHAWSNLGIRTIAFIAVLPLVLRLLGMLHRAL